MPVLAPDTETDSPESEFPRRYWLYFGFGLGLVVTLLLGFGVLIATAPSPYGEPGPTLPATGATEVTVIGTEFSFEPEDLILSRSATITFDNQGQVVHNIEIDGVEGFRIEAEAGQIASGTLDVDPGSYVIFCSIPGHREAGMVGTLTVADS